MSKDNGGSAFPTVEANYHNENVRSEGLSIRDYFAGKAMQGMLCNGFAPAMGQEDYEDFDYAKIAYKMADAMLAERSKPNEQ